MKKTLTTLFTLLLFVGAVQARTNIPLVKDTPHTGTEDDRARIPIAAPIAYIEGDSVIIEFQSVTTTEVMISTRDVVNGKKRINLYYEAFVSTDRVSINLKEQGIGSGDYLLQLTFGGIWWAGYFTVKETNGYLVTSDFYAKVDSAVYKLSTEDMTAEYVRFDRWFYSPKYTIPSVINYEGKNYSVTKIGPTAFYEKPYFSTIIIPEGITSIGADAFSGCPHLSTVVVPSTIKALPSGAFFGCEELSSVTLSEGLETIGASAFQLCKKLASITLPQTLSTINEGAFRDCSSLTTISLPDSITTIGDMAFSRCTRLESIVLPKNLKTMGQNVFKECSDLAVTISYGFTTIPENFLFGCDGVKSIEIPSSVTTIEYYAFRKCTGLTYVSIPNSVTKIGYGAFDYCSSLTSAELSNALDTIPIGLFSNCSSLEKIVIPEGVVYIDRSVFFFCKNLVSVTIPNSVNFIGSNAFSNCIKLASVRIPDNITEISNSTFESCKSLTSITIPENVTKIGNLAFRGCTNLTSITCYAKEPPKLGANAFTTFGTVHVLPGCKAKYMESSWKQFTIVEDADTYIELPLTETRDDVETKRAYDLTGRPVDDSYNGIVIINGKKTFIK